MQDIFRGLLSKGYDRVNEMSRVGFTNFVYGGLNVVHGEDGIGKSYQIVSCFPEIDDVIYFDVEDTASKAFVKHCESNGVHFVSKRAVEDECQGKDLSERIMTLVKGVVIQNRSDNPDFRPVIILDSLTLTVPKEDTVSLMYRLNSHAREYNYSSILIDNDLSKDRRGAITISRYEPMSSYNYALGGTYTLEKIKDETSELELGREFTVSNMNVGTALTWIKEYHPDWLTKSFPRSEMNEATKKPKDRWVRKYILSIFNRVIEGKSESYLYKG